MTTTLLLHIIAGTVGLLSGYLALYSTKGAPLHRRAGTVFVYAMLAMCVLGFIVAIARNAAPVINLPAASITAYLVFTSWRTVRPGVPRTRWIDRAATGVALLVGVVSIGFGVAAIAEGGARAGIAFPCFLFGAVGVLGGIGDLKLLRAEPLRGAARLSRHLWRMCFALFVAALSFFVGQSDELPQALRTPALIAVPPLAVLATMGYWLWRVRRPRKSAQVAFRDAATLANS
ncbi:MAG TPA: hypothetical protein VND91_04610 [Candidatus Saccharimonadia bacterium]|nr:hypothetical protein [Candidatus Saccharimonadia bacterium]